MDVFSVLNMLGGLALFLYGMHVMGQSLGKLAGGHFEKLLEKMTDNPVKAVLLGAVVTAVIQSSSATTVMVVGFVNSGLMSLSQSVGIIMGANIGTTITSWFLSLTGLEGSSLFIKLLKPSSFTPVLAMAGIIFVLFSKSMRKKDLGTILLGFAILMFGMETMSGAVKPLAHMPGFTKLFVAFENPVLGMCAGAVLTAIIQSSSASVGILQALCITGGVSMASAIPIIMGQNIGTCVTALISSIGAQKNARRSALVHFYFNLIGTIVFMVAYYLVKMFVSFKFDQGMATATSIAIVHTTFNVGATILFLPVHKLFEKLTLLTIPYTKDEEQKKENELFDKRLLETPGIAVALIRYHICDMALSVVKGFDYCNLCLSKYDEKYIKKIMNIEEEMDLFQSSLTDAIQKLASKELGSKDSQRIIIYEKALIDFERISDYEKSIAFDIKKLNETGSFFSEKGQSEAKQIFSETSDFLEEVVNAFIHEEEGDSSRPGEFSRRKNLIKQLKHDIKKSHKDRLEKGECSVETGILLIDMVTSLNRIAGHLENIGETL